VYRILSKSKKLFVDGQTYGRTDTRTHGHTDGRKVATHIIRSTSKVWKST